MVVYPAVGVGAFLKAINARLIASPMTSIDRSLDPLVTKLVSRPAIREEGRDPLDPRVRSKFFVTGLFERTTLHNRAVQREFPLPRGGGEVGLNIA
jgi:hypothetical protein